MPILRCGAFRDRAVGLRPFHKGGTMAGTALTAGTRRGGHLVIPA